MSDVPTPDDAPVEDVPTPEDVQPVLQPTGRDFVAQGLGPDGRVPVPSPFLPGTDPHTPLEPVDPDWRPDYYPPPLSPGNPNRPE